MRPLLIAFVFFLSLFTFHISASLDTGFSLLTFVYAHTETAVIKMTPNGFEPQELEVDTNSTVIFVNQDKVARWPASNIHPTHGIYPEFDPKQPIEPGKDWTFKPEKAGSWKFHDHLLPHFRGVLIVKEEGGLEVDSNGREDSLFEKIKSSITVILSRFASLTVNSAKNLSTSLRFFNVTDIKSEILRRFTPQDDNADFTSFSTLSPDEQIKTISDMAKKKGVENTWHFFRETFKGQGGSSGNIHDLAHLTGSLIYKDKGFPGITICSTEFAFGCYHGFLDTAFEKSLDDIGKAEEACSKLGSGGPFASCIHGIGHGVASFHSTSDLKASLISCRRLINGRDFCFDGVFMEFARSAPESFYKLDDPLYPCNELESEFGPQYSIACGRNQPSVLMSRFKKGFDEVIGICLSSKSAQFKNACFDSLGFSIASTGDPEQIIAGCQRTLVQEYIVRCTKSAAGELIFQEVPLWHIKAPKICASLSSPFNTECQNYIENLIKDYGRKPTNNFSYFKSGDENEYLRSQLKLCYESNGKNNCYRDVGEIFFDQFGMKKTLDLLARNENFPEVYARCHEVTHFLSRAEYEKLGNIADVYAQCDSTCHGGCYHGTLEAYLQQRNLDGEKLKSEFGKVCGVRQDYSSALVFNECLHGMGHAAMYVTDTDLILSLALCDEIQTQDGKERCYSGAFMENSSSSTNRDHPGKYVKADDPMFPCNSLEEKYQRLCWRYQSSYFAIISKQDWQKVVTLCNQVPGKYQDECFRTIGTNQVGFTQDLNKMKSDCDLAPNQNFQSICMNGVISSFSYRFVGDSSKMIQFCNIVDEDEKEGCFKQIGLGVLDWGNNSQLVKTECSKIQNSKYSSWCMSVI